MECTKLQKSQIHEHLVRSRDGSSECPNTKKIGRDVSTIDGCYFASVLIEEGAYTVEVLVFTETKVRFMPLIRLSMYFLF